MTEPASHAPENDSPITSALDNYSAMFSEFQQKKKSKLLRHLMIVLAVGIIGVAGYFSYQAMAQQDWETELSNGSTRIDNPYYQPPAEQVDP